MLPIANDVIAAAIDLGILTSDNILTAAASAVVHAECPAHTRGAGLLIVAVIGITLENDPPSAVAGADVTIVDWRFTGIDLVPSRANPNSRVKGTLAGGLLAVVKFRSVVELPLRK